MSASRTHKRRQTAELDPLIVVAIQRGILEIKDARITYNLPTKKTYDWDDPEELVRARTVAFLILEKNYPLNRIRVEVTVPRRTPSDFADVVVYRDDQCREPYLVVENKAANQSRGKRQQAIEQLFGNANSLRAELALYDELSESIFYDVASFRQTERRANVRGTRDAVPEQYGEVPRYTHIAGRPGDIHAVAPAIVENLIRRAHSIIWSGGKRDPLKSFDEWSKLLFAKVIDEKHTPTGEPRRFQVGTNETTAAVANRIHDLFADAVRLDPTIFPDGIRIDLPDRKIFDVVETLQSISFTGTDVDNIGVAFENFFGSVFRGELGQYFTMRPLARFTVAMLDIDHRSFLLDPTSGSGGFLLEALLQVWHRIDREFEGQDAAHVTRIKTDFALQNVYGIEIHETLARICKINLLLHHDGHTNIEADRSCLDIDFSKPRLQGTRGRFNCVVGNPPFGDEVAEGDEDHLGGNHLENFVVAEGRSSVDSEHVILERSIQFLEPGGRLGLVVPDGLLNNSGEMSNCPNVRRFLARSGRIEAIVSLPDYAFRKSGAQNKTSILFFEKFKRDDASRFNRALSNALRIEATEAEAIEAAWRTMRHRVFLAEANHIGYTTTGASSPHNDLYRGQEAGKLELDQRGTILGEYRKFRLGPAQYEGRTHPDCMAIDFAELWGAHESNRMDPKYFLFKREESGFTPPGWLRRPVTEVLRKREEEFDPAAAPDQHVRVITLSQTGQIRDREAGKGRNPPEWIASYFEDSTSTWHKARAGDVVYSSIDLWKGCIAVVPDDFDGALVTKEFPIFEVIEENLDPEFVSCLLRSRYYQRAFRAITTGHSNRRRTQLGDFEALELCFPPTREEQRRFIADINAARAVQRQAGQSYSDAMREFNDVVDGGRGEELPEIDALSDDNAEEEGE
jgi:type I restriction enzyme M protein